MYNLFWSLRLSPVATGFRWAESEFKSQAAMMKSLGDNGFDGRSSDGDDKTSRIVLMSCTASLGAFAAGCGRGIVLSSKVILQPLAWSTFLAKCYSLQMIIWLSCNLHGGSSLRGGAPAPSDWRATSFGRLVESIVAQWIQVIRAAHRVVRSLEGWLESAGECASGEVFLPIKLLLMPLAISIAFAIMHYRIAGYL